MEFKIVKSHGPNQSSRQGYTPIAITSHITEGSYSGAVSWLKNPASAASANYVVSQKGEITEIVPIDRMSWANGTSVIESSVVYYGLSKSPLVRSMATNANFYTVSIEHEGVYAKTGGVLTEAQYKATLWLHRHIIKEVKRIYGHTIEPSRYYMLAHSEVSPRTRTNCPGAMFPWERLINDLKGGSVTHQYKVGQLVMVKEGAKDLNSKKALSKSTYSLVMQIMQIDGNRIVLSYNGIIMAAINAKDLHTNLPKEDDMLKTAIYISSESDRELARRVEAKTKAPVYNGAAGITGKDILAKELIVVGGKVPQNYKGTVKLLSGPNFFRTVENVEKFLGGK